MLKYRIKYVQDCGFFAQVKEDTWYTYWQTIGKRLGLNSFGLYPEDNTKYPMRNYEEAYQRILDYDLTKKTHPKIIHYPVNLS
jgi:hypothetical protein